MPHGPWTGDMIAQLTLIGTCQGQQIVNVHHFEAGPNAPPTVAPDATAIDWSEDLADHWIANLKTNWLNCHTSDYKLNMVKAQVVERTALVSHRLTPVEKSLTSANDGMASGVADDLQTCVSIKWRTAVASKFTRGRTYIGPVPQAYQALGRLGTSPVGVLNYGQYATQMLAWYKAGAGTDEELYRLTIYSRPYNQGTYGYPKGRHPNRIIYYPPDYAGNSEHVTAGVVDPILRTQRRRVLGVGS